MILIMMRFNFLSKKKILGRLKRKKNCINVYCFENKLIFPIYVSDQRLESSMDLLRVTDKNKSYLVYFREFERFIFHETKDKNKK